MRCSFVAALVVSGAMVCAFVAQARAQEEGGRGRGRRRGNEHSMTGCLKKGTTAGSYIVTNVEGNGTTDPKSIGIVSSTADLAPHVGHKITVIGFTVPVNEAEAMNPAPPKAEHYMTLDAPHKMVSTTCP